VADASTGSLKAGDAELGANPVKEEGVFAKGS
jgi:hypothetical protein